MKFTSFAKTKKLLLDSSVCQAGVFIITFSIDDFRKAFNITLLEFCPALWAIGCA